ncbi:MAG: aspartate dehydrogenase [Clostridiales bacterium]|nr:aspartate dehydrogenase [Candidatus Blautia equi]
MKESFPYDPEKQIPVVRSSICTGEKVVGFLDKETGHFMEVMILHNEEEKKCFMKIYGLSDIRTDY